MTRYAINHIGYLTDDIAATGKQFEIFGYCADEVIHDDTQRTRICFLRKEGELVIELVEPYADNKTMQRMLAKLPRKLQVNLQITGEQIRLARLRRDLSISQVAERATVSDLSVSRVEKGLPTVSMGIYLRVLYALQLEEDILLLAKDDAMGKALQDLRLTPRQRASKKE